VTKQFKIEAFMSHNNYDCVFETVGLTKSYGAKRVLDRLDLRIPRGRIHALVGANGAGKSTLFRILLGFLPPSGGKAFLLGQDSRKLSPELRGRVGFVNEEHSLPEWMSVEAVTAMQRRHYPRWSARAFDAVIGNYNIAPEQKVGQLSRGERAGFNLALALAQSPELLILDEPTLGLDVVAKRAFMESLIYSNAAEDCSIIYCSHQMEEIERLADNLIILERGRLVNMSPPDEFVERVSHWIADVPFKGPDPATIPGLLQVQRIDGLHHFVVLDQDESFASFLKAAGAKHVQNQGVSLDKAVNAFLAKNHAAPQDQPAHQI
jgi:ABC-2 type transport system ATP-binding protein